MARTDRCRCWCRCLALLEDTEPNGQKLANAQRGSSLFPLIYPGIAAALACRWDNGGCARGYCSRRMSSCVIWKNEGGGHNYLLPMSSVSTFQYQAGHVEGTGSQVAALSSPRPTFLQCQYCTQVLTYLGTIHTYVEIGIAFIHTYT